MVTFKLRLLPMLLAMASSLAMAQEPEAEAAMEADSDATEEIVVIGTRGAELNAREIERNKNIFSSVISQDDAGNFADQNVAESLQRLPGITLQKSEGEGKFVTLRGLGPGFVSVNMNGAEIASAGAGPEDADNRGFALDAIPADLLGSIEVFKSLTPDLELNSIAGLVNVKTVSPFDRNKNSLKMSAQSIYQDYAGEAQPKFTVQGTNLFAGDTFGMGYSFSTEKRNTEVYETRHHNDNLLRYVTPNAPGVPASDDIMLIPFEFENREEDAERTRNAGTLDFGFRPDDKSDYYARFSVTEFTDLDIALREYYRFGQANAGSSASFLTPGAAATTAFIDLDENTFGLVNADLQHQFFIQESTTTTTVMSLGGKNVLGDSWNLDYDYTHSVGELDKPDARRVQFRSRFLPMLGRFGDDFINGQVISPTQMADLSGNDVGDFSIPSISGYGGSGYIGGNRVQPNMDYDNIFIEDSFRKDTLDQIAINLRKDFDGGLLTYVKGGFAIKGRERDRDKDRWSIIPSDFASGGCEGNLECLAFANSELGDFDTYAPNNPAFDHEFITKSQASGLLDTTEVIARFTDPNQTDQESIKEDYLLTEDIAALYLMTELQFGDRSFLIVGGRYEQTEFDSDGYLSIRNDRFETAGNPAVFDIAIPLTGTKNDYNDFFPSIHYRFEMSEEVLVRAALWSSFTRPAFDQSRAFIEVDGRVRLCNNDQLSAFFGQCSDNPGTIGAGSAQDVADDFIFSADNTISIGNPQLLAMTSNNFDASIGWYDGEDRFMQAAVFYKDIQDFIVSVTGVNSTLGDMPLAIPVDQITQFTIPDQVYTNVNYALNGEEAQVFGIELSYSEYFSSGWLEGFFIQSNLTLMDSEADVGNTKRSDKIQLPDQANEVANLTIGWENEKWNARIINNYNGKILKRIGSCTDEDIQVDDTLGFPQNCQKWADIYQGESLGVDLKLTYQVTENIKIAFDALNVTENEDIQYFQGNIFSNGNVLFRSENYGSSYQLGVNIKLY
jgi:iron complex outermembrane receptor protein